VSAFVLVRHASAGSRREWVGDDRLRPLDKRGEKQARRLVEELAGRELDRIVSSPYVRCVETVRPLAAERGLDLEERPEIAEGASREEIFRLLDDLEGSASLLCTHGDVVFELLGEAMKKGQVRLVERCGDEALPAD
jgi:phosphohistidine phosphatase SixA